MKDRASLVISTLALVVALTTAGAWAQTNLITGAQIKNGTLTTKDLHNNTVASTDIHNGTVSTADIGSEQVTSPDIGANQVTPTDVQLPPPSETTPNGVSGPVTDQFTKLADVGTYNKTQAESLLNVTWSGAVASGSGTNCVFQVRVNGAEPNAGGGEVFSTQGAVNVSTTALFAGIGTGPLTVEVWAKYSAQFSAPTCILGPSNPGIDNTFVITEEVI
jgi:hypothetical protein